MISVGSLASALVAAPAHADPTQLWSTYQGGTGQDFSTDVTFDSDAAVVVAGTTLSSESIAGSLAGYSVHDSTLSGPSDGFLSKFDNAGIRKWSTYYGGAGSEELLSLAVDPNNAVVAVGYTSSTNTSNVIATTGDTALNGTYDGMLVKFHANGNRLWGTYIGGSGIDYAYGVCVGTTGTIYVVGTSSSTDLGTAGVHQSTRNGSQDAFIAKVTGAGTLVWATYYGGAGGPTSASDCVVDANHDVYITGVTQSNVGIAHNGHDNTIGGTRDAFVAKFSTNGVLLRGSYYGGSGDDTGRAIDLDGSNNIYVAGHTYSANTGNVIDTTGGTLQGVGDAFIVKFNANFFRQWGRYYGGSGTVDRFYDLEVTGNGVMVSGETNSPNLISTPDALHTTLGGSNDGMFVAFDASDGDAYYATYLTSTSSTSGELAAGVAANFNQVALGGDTYGPGMATAGAHDTTNSGAKDAIVMLFRMFAN